MTKQTQRIAEFATRARYEDLSADALLQLKIRALDAFGCAIGAVAEGTPRVVRDFVLSYGAGEPCSLIGGGTAAPDRAALANGSFVRYLDFNDSYLAPGETCHPSDNLAAVLAAAETADAHGRDVLAALAVAYQVQCRLCDAAPVRHRGFDHVSQLVVGAAAGVARALGLDVQRAANAVAIGGTALHALRVTRTGALSNWKGLAAPFGAACATEAALLAARGITGPLELFEGNKGFMDTLSGRFDIDWSREDLEIVRRTIVKRYNAEVHSQSAIDCLLELAREHAIAADQVEHIDVAIFDVAHQIIGGGEEGDKTQVSTKEEADHSLPYILAVALLDGTVMPPQYAPPRIRSADVQALLRRVSVHPDPALSARFPKEMPCRITVSLRSGQTLSREARDYPGFHSRPLDWGTAVAKFESLAAPRCPADLLAQLAEAVQRLDSVRARELTALFGQVRLPEISAATQQTEV